MSFVLPLLFFIATLASVVLGFKLGFYSGCYEVLSRAGGLDRTIEKNGNAFIKQEWKLFIKMVGPQSVDSRFFTHIKRLTKQRALRG